MIRNTGFFLALSIALFAGFSWVARRCTSSEPWQHFPPAKVVAQNRGSRNVEVSETAKLYSGNRCGPAALYAVCSAYGISTSVDELSQLSGQESRGTTIAGLVRAAQLKDLHAVAFESN